MQVQDGLAGLLAEMEGIAGLSWIRLLYAYPNHVTPELVAAMVETPSVCHYLDVPLQHGDPDRPLVTVSARQALSELIRPPYFPLTFDTYPIPVQVAPPCDLSREEFTRADENRVGWGHGMSSCNLTAVVTPVSSAQHTSLVSSIAHNID